VNGHRIYFIKRKAAIYNVASGGYTRINKEKKIKRRQSTTLEQTGLKRGGNRGG
jgi:putative component of toxin-antitoxin plasmid stabilization module